MTYSSIQGSCPVCHNDNSLRTLPTKITIATARIAFEEMQSGRNLTQHHMRGTYVNPPMAALWNQHLKTLRWLGMLDEETVKTK
jgi:hypothetical protein